MMSRDSIIFIVPSMKSGGLERVASVFLNTIVSLGHTNVVLINLSSTPSFYKLDDAIVYYSVSEHITKKNKISRTLSTRKWLRKIVKQYDAPKILSFGEGYNAFVIFSLLGLKTNLYVANRASPLSSLKGFRGWVNPFFYKFTQGVFVQTHLAQTLLQPRYKKVNFHVLPNPIDLPTAEDHFENKENVILNVGRIGGNKNQAFLIDYLQNLHFESYDWKVHFIGDGPQRKSLEYSINNAGLSKKVTVLGTQDNVKAYYKKAKIFAFTSTSEGFPNVLLEAMSYGLPCISFDCVAGPSDLIEDGVDGFLIPLGRHDLYQEKLLKLMTDKVLWASMSDKAKQKAVRYDSIAITKQLLQVILGDENCN